MKQTAYLFTAGITQSQVRPSPGPRGGASLQTWDSCTSAIVCGGEAGQAQKVFEDWCRLSPEGQNPAVMAIKKIVGAEFVDQLLTELGGQPLDWGGISRRFLDAGPIGAKEEAGTTDDFAEGYWVDVNVAVPPESIRSDMESLQRDLPEEIRSGLNWSADNEFLFLVTVLSSPARERERIEEVDPQETDSDPSAQDNRGEVNVALDDVIARLPEMREKEVAALVVARNSVVAGWLWRKFAATTRLASNEILISPCCALIPVESR